MAQLSVARSLREEALEAYRTLPAPGPQPGRYWKIDVSKIEPPQLTAEPLETSLHFDASLSAKGLIVCDLATAVREHSALVASVQGTTVDWRVQKFAALNVALREGGTFVYVPRGLSVDAPIAIGYRVAGGASFPYTLVAAAEGSRATVVAHVEGGSPGALVSEIVEINVGANAHLTFAGVQSLEGQARIFSTKRGRIADGGALRWAIAELGAQLSVSDVRSAAVARGGETSISGIFFAANDQHVDLKVEVDHEVGDTRSETLFKSAATDRGQARFLGNIRIQPRAHGSDATLRDDALLLSKNAHIDSIPALEIGANDVKAYHGATVGAVSEDEVFYAMSRGIDRRSAERMITLGFFEPAIARFPTETLREELRETLVRKLA